MSETKNVTINYFKLLGADEVFYADLDDRLSTLSEGGMDYGFFDGRSCELMFKIFEPIELADRRLHFVSLLKEKLLCPVWFNRDGHIQEAPLEGGMLGDISYGLIDPVKKCVVMFASGFGYSGASFADFARWLTDDANAGVEPIFVDNVYDQVRDWEIYRKLNVAVEAPAVDYTDNVLNSPFGAGFGMLDTLKGLKIDISVSMGNGKGSLDRDLVRKFLQSMIEEGFAGKLKVSGKNFDEQSTEVLDIYNARLKYKSAIVVSGTHISPAEARSALFEAYQINQDEIEKAALSITFEEEV